MSTEALRKAVEDIDRIFDHLDGDAYGDWRAVRCALHDQEAEIARLREQAAMSMGVGTGDGQLFVYGSYESIKAAQAIVFRAEQAESALATHRANYDALVIRLGEVTARLEAADGLIKKARHVIYGTNVTLRSAIETHLKAADHV